MGHPPGELSKGRVQRLHLRTPALPLLHLLGGHRARLAAQQTKHRRADFSGPTQMNLTNQQMAHLANGEGAACTSIGWVTGDNSCNNPNAFLNSAVKLSKNNISLTVRCDILASNEWTEQTDLLQNGHEQKYCCGTASPSAENTGCFSKLV